MEKFDHGQWKIAFLILNDEIRRIKGRSPGPSGSALAYAMCEFERHESQRRAEERD